MIAHRSARTKTNDIRCWIVWGGRGGLRSSRTLRPPQSPSCFWRGGSQEGGGGIGERSRRLIPQSELTSRSLHISGKGGRNLTGEDGWMDRGRMETLYYLNAHARHAPFPALIWPAGSFVYTSLTIADFVLNCLNFQRLRFPKWYFIDDIIWSSNDTISNDIIWIRNVQLIKCAMLLFSESFCTQTKRNGNKSLTYQSLLILMYSEPNSDGVDLSIWNWSKD